VIDGVPAPIVSVRVLVAVCGVGAVASATWNVSERFVAVTVGIPLIIPVVVLNVNPLGSVPPVRDQVYGLTPPTAASVALYATPCVPIGSDLVVMMGVANVPTISVSVVEVPICCGVAESFTWNTSCAVAAAVGVPLMIPVAGSSDNPLGIVPETRENVNGTIPPVVINWNEYGTPICAGSSAVVVNIGGPGVPTMMVAVVSGTLGSALA